MTGLIYVAIIAVWAVVLVPAWLRRHDHLDPERSVDRFARSMKTLAARPSVLGIPMPVHEPPAAPDQPEAEVVTPRRRIRTRTRGLAVVRRRDRGAQQSGGRRIRPRLSAAKRRRIVLAVLLLALLVVAGLVVTGLLPPPVLAVPATLVVGFLIVARTQVRAARRRRRGAPQRREAGTPLVTALDATTTPVAGAAGSTWEPRATPLPSYVTAPPATGYPRPIDQAPGAWTAAAMLERAQKQKDRAERMAAAKAEAIARARAEQEAAQVTSRDDDFLAGEAAASIHDTIPLRRVRVVNE